MKLSHPLFVVLLLLSACQAPTQLPPQPGFEHPSASPSATPSATPTPSVTPVPTGSPSTECNSNSATVQFAVYANPRDQDFTYYSIPFDKSQPLNTAQLSINGVSGSVNGNQLSAPRPDSAPEVRITAPGYAPLVVPYLSNNQLCQNNVVALSPLSAEEQAGSEVPLQKISFAEGVSLNRHAESGLEYAVINSIEEFENLAPRLRSAWNQGPLPEATLAPLREGLAAGYKLALVSNGSQGLGDLFALVHRVTDAGSTTILASHLNSLMQEPSPPRPVGDRFAREIEAVLIPGDTDTLVLDLLRAGAGGGRKQRLEMALADAKLPVQPDPAS
ncbi:MAG: hypothetical protein ACO1RX_07375 [Candidatus Sericytochromatia bacterium]